MRLLTTNLLLNQQVTTLCCMSQDVSQIDSTETQSDKKKNDQIKRTRA